MKGVATVVLAVSVVAIASPARSQGFDPRQPLGALISAFQNCGPANIYQMLSPQLFNVVFQQTGGSGCYSQIAAAGPIQNLQVIGQQNYPLGPLFVIRVAHPSFAVDWAIGFNQFTSKVEYLTFQSAQNTPVLPPPGPLPSGGSPPVGGTPPAPEGGSPTTSGSSDGCDLYPVMCQ